MAAFSDIINSAPVVLVDFSAEWCGPCKVLGPILKQVKEELGDAVKIVKIDVDRNPQIAGAYQIQGVPTMILFRNGQQVWRQSGVMSKNEIVRIVNTMPS